jgi:hypothetical protein
VLDQGEGLGHRGAYSGAGEVAENSSDSVLVCAIARVHWAAVSSLHVTLCVLSQPTILALLVEVCRRGRYCGRWIRSRRC